MELRASASLVRADKPKVKTVVKLHHGNPKTPTQPGAFSSLDSQLFHICLQLSQLASAAVRVETRNLHLIQIHHVYHRESLKHHQIGQKENEERKQRCLRRRKRLRTSGDCRQLLGFLHFAIERLESFEEASFSFDSLRLETLIYFTRKIYKFYI